MDWPFPAHLGSVCGDEAVQRGHLFPNQGFIRVLLRALTLNTLRPHTPPYLALAPLKRRSAPRDTRAPRAPLVCLPAPVKHESTFYPSRPWIRRIARISSMCSGIWVATMVTRSPKLRLRPE